MELLKRRRTAYRSAFTRVANELEQLFSTDTEVNEIEAKWPLFLEKQQRLTNENEVVFEQLLSDGADESELTAEIEICDEYVTTYNRLKVLYDKLSRGTADMVSMASVRESSLLRPATARTRKYKLPTIDFKKFGGDVKEWLPFWSQFKKIDADEEIASEDKFQYLLQAILPNTRAQELVESYPPTAENYSKAIESLKSRFGREDILIEVYVRELLKLVLANVLSRDNKMGLSTLYDKIETQLRALDTLGVSTATCAAMLYPLVESCLPEDLLRVWQRSSDFSTSTDSTLKDRLTRLMVFLRVEVESEERISLAIEGFGLNSHDNKSKRGKAKVVEIKQPTAYGLMNLQSVKCLFCEGSHSTEKCFKAQKLKLEEKNQILKEKKACFRCAKIGHSSRKCRERLRCIICGRQHIVVLCPNLTLAKGSGTSVQPTINEAEAENQDKVLANYTDNQVILQTLRVMMRSEHGIKEIRAVIDSGSQRSYVLKRTAEELQYLPKETVKVVHSLFGGNNTAEQQHTCYDVRLLSKDGKFACTFEVLDQHVICNGIPYVEPGPWMKELKSLNAELTDTLGSHSIELLIGADVAGKLYTGRHKQLSNGLVVFETLLGWTLMGKVPRKNASPNTAMTVTSLLSNDVKLTKLWELDVMGIGDPTAQYSKEEKEKAVKDFFQQTVCTSDDGRYEVKMPWVEGHPPLPSNYKMAKKRLECTIKKLESEGNFDGYNQVFREWMQEKIIEEVPKEELNSPAHYLPHRAVIKENSTTRIRPVFDASAKEKEQPSLNQCLEKGINLIETIPAIMLRFRQEKIGVVSDIRKAFLQIGLSKRDRDCLRFLWQREDGTEIVYRHRRVVFGVTCSPFLLGATIEHHLNHCLNNHDLTDSLYSKETISKLINSFYVDNCITSVSNQEALSKFIREATQVMAVAKFDLRGWEFSENVTDSLNMTSVLGMTWDRKNDILSISGEGKINLQCEAITKRLVLSIAQRIFDPLGFTCPATVFPKLLLQKMWKEGIGWDQEVDETCKASFLKWYVEMPLLFEIQIPRWIMGGLLEAQKLSLHIFCDASKHAYACVIYLRAEMQGTVFVHLIQAKARIAPLKGLSIPRLELLAAVIGARLYYSLRESFSRDVKTYFWSDSSTVLSWIRCREEWATFVWNRTQEIRQLTSVESWRHVPGAMNPADLPSRGCSPRHLLESRWWEGPEWLYDNEANWPKEDPEMNDQDEAEVNHERRKKIVTAMLNKDVDSWYSLHFSKYNKIVRMISWMLRFVHNSVKPQDRKAGELSSDELNIAERKLIYLIQRDSFDGQNDKRLTSLCCFKDEHDVIRVRSKISNREDTEGFRFPFVLPGKHVVVERLIYDLHVSSCHVGTQGLLSMLREKYWVLGGRRTVRSSINKCVTCKRYRQKRVEVNTPPLPVDRVKRAATFQITGIDLAGPLFLRNNRKVWICLFTCAIYRAVHLDIVTSLSTANFICALRRFIARRGRPSVIYTDNGTNFVGTANAFTQLDWELISQYSSAQRITWRFNPPSAPWWGGWWERLIGLLKQLLRRVLGRASLNLEELYTILCDCEAVLNSRPLTYVSEEQSDLVPLTPVMFLRDLVETDVTDCDLVDSNSLRKRLMYIQSLREILRSRFRSEYLGQLKELCKCKKTRSVSVNDIVLVGNDVTKRVNWPLGRVIELIPGKDNVVRLVRILTNGGQLLRPIQRVYPLECAEPPMGTSSVEHVYPLECVEPPTGTSSVGEEVNSEGGFPRDIAPPKTLPTEENNESARLFDKCANFKMKKSKRGRVIKLPQRYLD